MPDLSLATIAAACISHPPLLVIIVLSLGTLVMNGAHDASNAIATCVATRSMSPMAALAMAAICNFLGVLLSTFISGAVAKTILGMVNFSGNNHAALVALAAACVAIIVWGGLTWYFGLPTSQSHALVAGVTGAAIALQNGLHGVNFDEWSKVLWGLFAAAVLGFALGWLTSRVISWTCRFAEYPKADKVFGKLQDAAAALLAFLHGAHDGLKFMSICVLGMLLALGEDQGAHVTFPLWIMVASSLCMFLGTAIGGKKIIKSVGMHIVKMEKWEGFAATFAASICIYISNVTGMPISTTHTKTTAIMGVGTARNPKKVSWGVATNMVKTWIYTFPGCGIIGFVLAKVFIFLF